MAFHSRTAAQVLALTIVTGCQAYHPAREPVATGSVVRVHFDQPRMLTVARRSGDSVRVAAVTEIEGMLRKVRGDTLDIELRNIGPDAAARTIGRRARVAVAVVPPYEQPVEVLRVHTAAIALSVAFVAAVVVTWDLSMLPRT